VRQRAHPVPGADRGRQQVPRDGLRDCGATLSFGQNKKGGKLFPIRKLTADGKPSRLEGTFDAKHRGWSKWRGNVDDDGERAAPPAKGGGI
jgi:hypothetical protein